MTDEPNDNAETIDFAEFADVDFSTPADTSEATSTDEAQPNGENDESITSSPNYPGFWEPILSKVPEPFHADIAPTLKEWDKNFSRKIQETQQRYDPYKSFIDEGVDPVELQNSLSIYRTLEQDPKGFLELLKNQLISAGQYEEAAAVEQKQADLEGDDGEPDPYDQRLSQIEQQNQQLVQTLQQAHIAQQEAALHQQVEQAMANEFAQIEERTGPLPPAMRKQVMQQTYMMQQQLGREVSLVEGFREVAKFIQQTRAASPGANAPRILSSGGSVPAAQNVDLSNEDQRLAYAQSIVASLNP